MKLNERSYYFRCASVISVWLLGLFLGALAATRVEEAIPHYMRSLCADQIPLIGMIILLLSPFAVSAFLLRYRLRFLIFPVIALKAAFYSFCFCGFMFAFKDAGWLASGLFMFSTSCSAVLLIHFWLKHIFVPCVNKKMLQPYILISAFIAIADYYVISPFTAVFY